MDEELFILSDAAAREFENQDVFSTVKEFIDAMPPATRMVHLYPVDVDFLQNIEQQGVELRKWSNVFADAEDLFSWLTYTHTTPDREESPSEDESIFRVDDANDLTKNQDGEFMESGSVHDMHDKTGPMVPTDGVNYMRDEGMQDSGQMSVPYDYRGIPEHLRTHTKPGDYEDYSRNNFYRDFDLDPGANKDQAPGPDDNISKLYAQHMADHRPWTLPLGAVTGHEREIRAEHKEDGRVARLVPGPIRTLVSAKWGEIVQGLNPEVVAASKGCQVKLTRADPKNRRWTFTVHSTKSGSGRNHTVHLKVVPQGNTSKLNKLDLKIGCSCEFWKWQGPDHHAHTQGYLDQKKRSDGSTPEVRDPGGINKICKHVYAASELFMGYSLQKRPKTSRTRTASTVIDASSALNIRKLAILSDETHTSLADLATKIVATAQKIHT